MDSLKADIDFDSNEKREKKRAKILLIYQMRNTLNKFDAAKAYQTHQSIFC